MAKEYNISKVGGQCCRCERQFEVGQEYVATVIEANEELLRQDYCLDCCEATDHEVDSAVLGVWHAHVPKPKEKRKLLIDDNLIINFFTRLESAKEASMINFRFVLALVLMRKRLLIYDRSTRNEDGTEIWSMHLRGQSDKAISVVDPHMNEDTITEVGQQLGQIMEGEL